MPERSPHVALIEDDPVMGQSLIDWFGLEGYRTIWWRNGQSAIDGLATAKPDIVLCDIRLPDMTGEDILREAGPAIGRTPVVFITGFGDVAQAVRLMQSGAADYVTKPFDIEILMRRVEALIAPRWCMTEGWSLGQSPAIIEVERVIRRIASLDSTVLLQGPSGSGKEVAARLLHALGARAQLPLLAVNCASIPKDLLESEMFGHERGAFTGAHQRHEGHAERVQGGTLFLDEVSELPPDMQAKLLRLIEDRTFRRVGGDRLLPFRARLVAATNADLRERISKGLFREDLYFRLAVIVVDIPPLKSRVDDIVPLARRFVAEFAEVFDSRVRGLTPSAEEHLSSHDFPGNIRELRNRIERAVALCDLEWIGTADLFPETVPHVRGHAGRELSLAEAREAAERRVIVAALAATDGDVDLAADRLQVSRSTLFAKIKKLGVRS
ncbi:MAG: sigma-54 dependent transcriptional regulator [Hyphomicrobiaceae bacterium]|nr:sigma-54 dependent transcriptional regulator [Hyphomicrobiaceae bacterium]